uniref:Secreted protein n=1 Tax=Panagrellus redivivus TaxID=6233 RepID=A0A7E4VIZ8_PANRE
MGYAFLAMLDLSLPAYSIKHRRSGCQTNKTTDSRLYSKYDMTLTMVEDVPRRLTTLLRVGVTMLRATSSLGATENEWHRRYHCTDAFFGNCGFKNDVLQRLG